MVLTDCDTVAEITAVPLLVMTAVIATLAKLEATMSQPRRLIPTHPTVKVLTRPILVPNNFCVSAAISDCADIASLISTFLFAVISRLKEVTAIISKVLVP